LRGSGPVIAALRRAWSSGRSDGPKLEPSALDHPAHGKFRSKRRAPRIYSRRLPDESAKLSLKSKTHATWTYEGINIIFAQPQQPSTVHHTREEGSSRTQHSCQRKRSPLRRVRSPEDRIQPFVAIMPGEATKGSGAPNEILTYRYVKPQVQWFPNEEDPPTDPSRIAQGSGAMPIRHARRNLWQRDQVEPNLTATSAWGSKASRALGSRSTAQPNPVLGSCPANDASQGPGTRRQALGKRCSGAP
jgi:hypothetical protein